MGHTWGELAYPDDIGPKKPMKTKWRIVAYNKHTKQFWAYGQWCESGGYEFVSRADAHYHLRLAKYRGQVPLSMRTKIEKVPCLLSETSAAQSSDTTTSPSSTLS